MGTASVSQFHDQCASPRILASPRAQGANTRHDEIDAQPIRIVFESVRDGHRAFDVPSQSDQWTIGFAIVSDSHGAVFRFDCNRARGQSLEVAIAASGLSTKIERADLRATGYSFLKTSAGRPGAFWKVGISSVASNERIRDWPTK